MSKNPNVTGDDFAEMLSRIFGAKVVPVEIKPTKDACDGNCQHCKEHESETDEDDVIASVLSEILGAHVVPMHKAVAAVEKEKAKAKEEADKKNTEKDEIGDMIAEAISQRLGVPVDVIKSGMIEIDLDDADDENDDEPDCSNDECDGDCENCSTRIDFMKSMNRNDRAAFNIATSPIEKVLFNEPATIVFWKDGTKTVVTCAKEDKFDRHSGLALAICKKVMGNQMFHDIFDYLIPNES